MSETILFIHGMFQNAKSWNPWVSKFRAAGYHCIAESWPLHEGEPQDLRANPPAGLGDLRLQAVIDKYANEIRGMSSLPIVIGHSVGGLVVQKLAEMGLIKAGIAIASVAPNRMLSFDWGFFTNAIQITNPFVGDSIFEMSEEGFHKNFANTLSKEQSDTAFVATATHDSRNVLRDCMLETGKIDLDRVSQPLLFIAAEKDQIVPPNLCEKNASAYDEKKVMTDFIEFPDRSHFICREPGWEEVASSVLNWIRGLNELSTKSFDPETSRAM